MIVACRDSFAAAHVLSGYEGKCKNLHGHTYHVEAMVSSERLNDMGMAVDFNVLKKTLHDLLEQYDHAFLVGKTQTYTTDDRVAALCRELNLKTKFIALGHSTTENIAVQIKRELSAALREIDKYSYVVRVRVSESDKTYAEV